MGFKVNIIEQDRGGWVAEIWNVDGKQVYVSKEINYTKESARGEAKLFLVRNCHREFTIVEQYFPRDTRSTPGQTPPPPSPPQSISGQAPPGFT